MMSARERLEAKRRRTVKHPVLIGDPSEIAAELAQLQQAVQNVGTADTAEQDRLRAELKAVMERRQAQVELVELQSLSPDLWEQLTGDLEPDEQGWLDLAPVLPEVLAESCTDPELRDAEWWAMLLKRPDWSVGDRQALNHQLVTLNLYVPTGVPGKG